MDFSKLFGFSFCVDDLSLQLCEGDKAQGAM